MSEIAITAVFVAGGEPDQAKRALDSIIRQTIAEAESLQLILVVPQDENELLSYLQDHEERPALLDIDIVSYDPAAGIKDLSLDKRMIKGRLLNVCTDGTVWNTHAFDKVNRARCSDGRDAQVVIAKSDGHPRTEYVDPEPFTAGVAEVIRGRYLNPQAFFFSPDIVLSNEVPLGLFVADESAMAVFLVALANAAMISPGAIYIQKPDNMRVSFEESLAPCMDWIDEVAPGRLEEVFVGDASIQSGLFDLFEEKKLLEKRVNGSDERSGAISRVFSLLDEQLLVESGDLSTLQKAAFTLEKHGGASAVRVDSLSDRVIVDDVPVGSVEDAVECTLRSIYRQGRYLVFEGTISGLPEGEQCSIRIQDGRRKFDVGIQRYSASDVKDLRGSVMVPGLKFAVKVPGSRHRALRLIADLPSGRSVQIPLRAVNTSGLNSDYETSFCKKGNVLLELCDASQSAFVRVSTYSKKRHKKLEKVYAGELSARGDSYLRARRLERKTTLPELEDRVLLLTTRGNGAIDGNLAALQKHLTSPTVSMAKAEPYTAKDCREIIDAVLASKVVVTDDYNAFMKLLGKRKHQYFVQLWHAPGAFKKFGLDGTDLFPAVDADHHRDYDLVPVSAEGVRETYARAFGVALDKVRALGVPRTDAFFNDTWLEETRSRIYRYYPELRDKDIILYAPTFRGVSAMERATFKPKLDFDVVSQRLRDDQYLVVCPHPVMRTPIVSKSYSNIAEIRDLPTSELFTVGDLLVTDYSSVIFEFALLGKPMAFYCYDLNEYNRDFYLNYPADLPGPCFEKEDELIAFLAHGDRKAFDERRASFAEHYMGACDGHSAERIARCVDGFVER